VSFHREKLSDQLIMEAFFEEVILENEGDFDKDR
jgi:hypothetical protein